MVFEFSKAAWTLPVSRWHRVKRDGEAGPGTRSGLHGFRVGCWTCSELSTAEVCYM